MAALWARVRAVWRVVWRSRQLETDMRNEMRFHIEMEAERLVHEQGLGQQEARRQAHVAFGGIEKFQEEGRDARGRQWLDAIALDCRLGARMLVKHRWLTLVGSFAIAIAIAIGSASFEIVSAALHSTLPIEDADRVVALQYATDNIGDPERRIVHDFVEWREQLASIEQLGAFRTAEHNLVAADGRLQPIRVAEMSASGFAVARTPPFLGRYLIADDERAGAAPVIVIGHDEWQSRFAGDPSVVDRTIQLGLTHYVVVGVMPAGFGFPIDHQYWIPIQLTPAKYKRLEGPAIRVFGRLAAGVPFDQAQAELTAIAERTAAAYPGSYARLRAVVLPYTREHVDANDSLVAWMLWTFQLLVTGLLVIVAMNVAILVYARTMARQAEMAMRSALGASRRRILAQLFIEALALCVVGAASGIALAQLALGWLRDLLTASGGRLPYWFDLEVSIATMLYALVMAVLAAAIVGVPPALKATRRELHSHLREMGGGTGARLGGTWTSLVVAQVAIAITILPLAAFAVGEVVRMEVAQSALPGDEFLLAQLEPAAERAGARDFQALQLELIDRVRAESGVVAVSFSSGIPGFEGSRSVEFDPSTSPGAIEPGEANVLHVDLGLFDTYDAKLLAGRALSGSDLNGTTRTVVVNRSFVRRFLGDRSALGQRFHYDTRRDEWYEIVGVVSDFPDFPPQPGRERAAVVYHPAAAAGDHVILSIRLKGRDAGGFIGRLRELAADVAPDLPVHDIRSLRTYHDDQRSFWRFLVWGLAVVTSSVLLLSAAGIYALFSFTVAQRTREIGIRSALGGEPRRVLAGVFARAGRQLAIGLLIGSSLSGALLLALGLDARRAIPLLVAVAAITFAVGLLGAWGPARRALRVHVMEALRTG